MKDQHRFVVGESFENRKGAYTVLSISGDKMRIAFECGQQIDTVINDQERILLNIEREVRVSQPKTK